MGQRLTGMTSGQAKFPVANSMFKFAQHGKNGTWISELLPHTAAIADDICVIRSLHTEAINHDPAITFFQTGAQQAGRPSIGAWRSYGLGSENADLPAFVVLISRGTGRPLDQPLYDRLWGSGFLPSKHQGVKFRGVGDPVLYLPTRRASTTQTPPPHARRSREAQPAAARCDGRPGDRHAHRAVRAGVPHADDRAGADRPVEGAAERRSTCTAPRCSKRGTYAANCLLARRLSERGVRFVQLFHRGWDQHDNLPNGIRGQCKDTDQPSAALVKDLKQRGLLDETLVIWGGEFGRTVYGQGKLTNDNYGRDHHPRCFTIWMAGGGIKGGITLRRDRRLRLQHRQGPRPRPRPQRDDPALPGHRPHEADLPVPGPALPADRRARRSRQGHPRVAGGRAGQFNTSR